MATKEEIIIGVALLLGPKMNLDFSQAQECTWLVKAVEKYGEEGWRFHDSGSGSNLYRFKVWLLHIEATIRIDYLLSIGAHFHEVEDEKAWFHKKWMEWMEKIKAYDKMN